MLSALNEANDMQRMLLRKGEATSNVDRSKFVTVVRPNLSLRH